MQRRTGLAAFLWEMFPHELIVRSVVIESARGGRRGVRRRRGALVDEPLPLAVHGHLDVLQLVVAAHLQRREHRQAHPRGERAPRAELGCAYVHIEAIG